MVTTSKKRNALWGGDQNQKTPLESPKKKIKNHENKPRRPLNDGGHKGGPRKKEKCL